MIRITENQWEIALKNMTRAGLDLRVGGGAIGGCYTVSHNGKKIMHHQIEFEYYFEIDEDYIHYTEHGVASMCKRLKDIQIKQIELEKEENELVEKLEECYQYPSADEVLLIKYEGQKYSVINIDFYRQKVFLNSHEDFITIDLLEFDKAYSQWHEFKKVFWNSNDTITNGG